MSDESQRARPLQEGYAVGPTQGSLMILAGLLSISFIGVQAETRGWLSFGSAESADRVTTIAASVSLTVALLGIEAARQRWRVSHDAQTVHAALVLLILAAFVISPQFYLDSGSPKLDGILLTGHALAFVVAISFLRWPDLPQRNSLRHVAGIGGAVAALLAVSIFCITQLSTQSESALVFGFAVLAMCWFAASYVSIKRSFVTTNRRLRWLALLYLALAVSAVSQVSIITDAKPNASMSVTLLLGVGAVLYASVVELAQTVIIERDRSALAESETNQAIGRLVEQTRAHGEATHNTRNAIAAIDGGLRMLAKNPSPADQKWLLDSLRSEMRRLYTIMEQPQSASAVARFDVGEVILPMITCYRLAEHPVSLEADSTVWALGRAGDTAEVIQNLIHNAIRHANASSITVKLTADENDVVISVCDDGVGVKETDTDVIFDLGYRGAESLGFGLGTGLHSCRMMMQAQNGSVSLLESSGKGSIFEVRLPKATASDPLVIDLTDNAEAHQRRLLDQAAEIT